MHIIIVMLLITSVLAAPSLYSRVIKPAVPVSEPVAQPTGADQPLPPQPTPPIAAKNDIIKQLDDMLQRAAIDDAWYNAMDNLIFDLAFLDRDLANSYIKKIRTKTVEIAVAQTPPPVPRQPQVTVPVPPQPSPVPAQPQVPPPPPPPVPGKPKGTRPTPPPPPAPGQKPKAGTKPVPVAKPIPAVPKGPEPLSIRESYSAARLARQTDEALMELFNKLLEALDTVADFWNTKEKKPQLDWETKIGTVKRALLDPKRNIQIDINKKIEDRIAQVRTDKAQQGLKKQVAVEEEVKEGEASQEELIALIDDLKKRPAPSDHKWLIKFTGNVKKLDKINHEKALAYESEFIKKFPGQRPFLPKKREVVKIELTEEELQMAKIDKILVEKTPPGIWPIKAKGFIQELYDMNPEQGLRYQDKYIAATKDKPFLKLKE